MAAGSESGSGSDSANGSGSEGDEDDDDDGDEEYEEYDAGAELSADVIAQLHWTAVDAGGTTAGLGPLLGSETAADALAGGRASVPA